MVSLAMAALFAADMFLAKTEKAESQVEAARLFEQGRGLMQRGQNAEAIERIKEERRVHLEKIAKFTGMDVFFAHKRKNTMGDRRKGRHQA
jgi:hypothetical protein